VQQHPAILETHTLRWPDEAACEACARALAPGIASGPGMRRTFVALQGPLGAGKTSFARALLRELGVTGRIKSPTFALLEPYRVGDVSIAHVDLFRMEDPREFDDAGLRDAIADAGLALVEWPEKAGARLPTPDLRLRIAVDDDDRRTVDLDAFTPAGVALLRVARALERAPASP
jgi:tRNA threonylcarbamoyladenosine biosynthesis protein TsaE